MKLKYLFFAMRPRQWTKNLFIFLPLIFGKKLFIFPENLRSATAFFLFSIASGVVYLINDMIDAGKDRLHPTKRLRPIASGRLSKKYAGTGVFIFGALVVALSFKLNAYFGWVIIFYFAFNVVYTNVLKNVVIIDVFCVGGFFLSRIIAGVVIAAVEMSHWMIIMTLLLAMFLGFNKRRQEFKLLHRQAIHHRKVLTKYSSYFIDQIIAIITSSIVVVYMLYTVDERTVKEFGTNHLMYTIPFVYYGIFRYLYLLHKVTREGDPTRLLFLDRNTQVNLILWVSACILIIYFGF